MGQIYKITNRINGLSYIGQTKYAAIDRYNTHMNTYKNTKFYNSIHKYGQENFELEVLEDNVKEEDLDRLEIYYIALYDTYEHGYNETTGGQGIHGYKHTNENKLKIGEKAKAAWNNPESLLNDPKRNIKISKSNKGKLKSAEHRKKLSERASQRIGTKNNFYGKKHSIITKQRISDANSIAVDMFDLNMNFIQTFKNAKEAAIYLKNLQSLTIKQESIYRAINWHCSMSKPYKNYFWKYHKV